jgi:hypothetical protein
MTDRLDRARYPLPDSVVATAFEVANDARQHPNDFLVGDEDPPTIGMGGDFATVEEWHNHVAQKAGDEVIDAYEAKRDHQVALISGQLLKAWKLLGQAKADMALIAEHEKSSIAETSIVLIERLVNDIVEDCVQTAHEEAAIVDALPLLAEAHVNHIRTYAAAIAGIKLTAQMWDRLDLLARRRYGRNQWIAFELAQDIEAVHNGYSPTNVDNYAHRAELHANQAEEAVYGQRP